MLDEITGEEVIPTFIHTTNVEAESVQPGNIIAYATVKGRNVDTTFGYNLPYDSGLGIDLGYSGAMFNADGSVVLENKIPDSKTQIALLKAYALKMQGKI